MFNPRFSPRGPLSFKPDDIAPRASTTASKRFLAHQYTTITGAAQALRKLYSVVGSALRWSNKFRLVMKYSKQQYEKADAAIAEGPTPLSPRSRFRAAMILAMAADALQLFVFPLFAEGLCRPLMMCSISRSQPRWSACSAGTGNFCQHSLPNLCRESIWFLSGRWLSLTFIANGNRSRSSRKNLVSGPRR